MSWGNHRFELKSVGIALGASVGLALAPTAANAATAHFTCRASALRVTALRVATVEPAVANAPNDPCKNDAAPGVKASLAPLITAGVATADTVNGGHVRATASAGVANLAGVISATVAKSTASYRCTAGNSIPSSTSTVVALRLGGVPVTQSGSKVNLGPLGVATVDLDQTSVSSTGIVQRAVDITIAGGLDNGVRIVLGEANAGVHGNPCKASGGGGNGTGGGGGGRGNGGGGRGTGSHGCPAGAVLISRTDLCEIVLPGGKTIVIGRPGRVPTGGTVLPLASARKHYRSRCLYGAGPKYAVVGTNHADRIKGTNGADRILGLGGNDRISGQNGNDCIDGGSGSDQIHDGTGRDRIYGGAGSDKIWDGRGRDQIWAGSGNDRVWAGNGNDKVWGGAGSDRIWPGNGNDEVWAGPGRDRVWGGNGSDRLWGGSGNDTIWAGAGNDHVWGGPGNDVLVAGSGRDHLYGGGGNDRLFASGRVVYANCGAGKNVAHVPRPAVRYARKHGCERVTT
jgi:Ca2+-binding RTX toxin-like protein